MNNNKIEKHCEHCKFYSALGCQSTLICKNSNRYLSTNVQPAKLKRGDVFFADLGNKCRPWLVIQNDIGNKHSDRTIVVPLTSKIKKKLPTHVVVCYGNIINSAVQCEEIRTAKVKPEWEPVEHLPPEIMKHIDRALKIAIGLEVKKWEL